MKKVILSFIVLLFGSAGYAQNFNIGPRIGVSQSTLKVNQTYNQVKYNTGDPVVGFHAGVFARVKISSFYVQPELLFTSSGGKIKYTDDTPSANVNEVLRYTYNRIDVPIMVGYKVSILRFNLGPVASYNLSTKNKSPKALGKEVEGKYKDATWGVQGGIGVDIKKIVIDLKYETNLSSISNNVTINGQSYAFNQRSQQILLSVGLKLL